MATTSLQTEIKLIKQKKALYKKRAEDAKKKNRPDIEKIWLNEIKVLDEKHTKLIAKENGKEAKKVDPKKTTAKQERKLRQLTNQIAYVKRKIAIHKERGETLAVQKQTVLLLELEAKKSKLKPASTKTVETKPKSTKQSTRTLTSTEKKKLNTLNADITHADKMIKEYQKFKSPKAEIWIGKKFQLMAQRDKLLHGSATPAAKSPDSTHTTTPARATASTHSSPAIPHTSPAVAVTAPVQTPAAPMPMPPPLHSHQATIAEAQEINKQVRIIDFEIAHADKMIREYQKYRSPKANQWIHRKNELLARRSRITGKINQQQATLDDNAANLKRLNIITLELAHADKMVKEYQKYNSPKAHDWIERRNDLLAEKARLEGRGTVSSVTNNTHEPSHPTINRETIKAQITELNRKAKEADTNMRAALRRGDHQQANHLHQQRDHFNQQARQLTAQLSGVSSAVNSGATTHTSSTPAHTGSTHHSAGSSSALEKSIALKYLRTRNFTDEHAYMEIINTLTQGKYQSLSAAKETLFDITSATQLPPRNTVINAPFVRDCFKIKISDVLLDGYTINDTIFDTSFPRDFDAMVDRINQHVGPAPKLKSYLYLAHRDAIQLIPSDRSISKYHSQFAGAMLKNITIKNIRISSKGALQGLFASDGSFKNLHLENITVETNSAHQIAILGLLSGTLDLSSPNGHPIHIKLFPLRLAGGHNIYINSFSRNSSYQYGNVSAGRSNAKISDNRREMKKRGTYYKNFDMDAFFAAMRRSDPNANIFHNIKEAAKRAGTIAKVI